MPSDDVADRLMSFRRDEEPALEEDLRKAAADRDDEEMRGVESTRVIEAEEEEEAAEDDRLPTSTELQRVERVVLYAMLLTASLAGAVFCGFGTVYALLCAFLLIWYGGTSTRRRRAPDGRHYSAYSVFNRDCVRLPGQLTAEHFEEMFRRGQGFI